MLRCNVAILMCKLFGIIINTFAFRSAHGRDLAFRIVLQFLNKLNINVLQVCRTNLPSIL